ncbi:hypothetical protein D9M68_499350 [compost metagenome]
MPLLDPRELPGQKVQHLVPFHAHIAVASPAGVRPGPPLEPAAPHHGRGHADWMVQRIGEVVDQRIRIRIAGVRLNIQDAALPGGGKHAPVGAVGLAAGVGPRRGSGIAVHVSRRRDPW